MNFGLLIAGSFLISGFTDIKDCMDARDIVARQMDKPNTAGVVLCIPLPEKGHIVGRGASRPTN